jgi:hypothetical protein
MAFSRLLNSMVEEGVSDFIRGVRKRAYLSCILQMTY